MPRLHRRFAFLLFFPFFRVLLIRLAKLFRTFYELFLVGGRLRQYRGLVQEAARLVFLDVGVNGPNAHPSSFYELPLSLCIFCIGFLTQTFLRQIFHE